MTFHQMFLVLVSLLFSACVLFDESAPKKPAATGLIATPASYYSTAKAKYLGSRYKENLDRLVERIARNSKTSALQFANNISSVGGIGFFTHSATKTPDERYLEVVLATPETFETKGDVSDKVQQLFSRYGAELLGILTSDGDIYRDKELSGYGLNLAWRNVITESSGSRVTLARAIIYVPKERTQNFLHNDIKQSDLLTDAVIFAVDEDGPLNLVSYKPQPLRPEIRPAIQEDDLTSSPLVSTQERPSSAESVKAAEQKMDQKLEVAKKDSAVMAPPLKAARQESKAETQKVSSSQKMSAKPAEAIEGPIKDAPKLSSPIQSKGAKQVASPKQTEIVTPWTPTIEPTVEGDSDAKQLAATTPANASEATTPEPPLTWIPMVQRDASLVEKPQRTGEQPAQAAQRVAPAGNPDPAREPTVETTKAAPREAGSPVAQPTEKRPTVEPQKVEQKIVTPAPLVAKNETLSVPAPRRVEIVPTTQGETIPAAQTNEVMENATSTVKATEAARGAKPTVGTQVTAPLQKQPQPTQTSSASNKSVVGKKLDDLSAPESALSREPVAPPFLSSTPEPVKNALATNVSKAETQPVEVKRATPTIVTEPKQLATEQANEQVAVLNKPVETTPEKSPTAKAIVQTSTPEQVKSVAAPVAKAKPESIEVKPSLPAPVTRPKEIAVERPANEQLALLTKPPEPAVERKPVAPAVQKALEGFIIQLAFNDRNKARQWAESMERRGYAVSVTEAGAEGALRVRLGNFIVRDEAERQLRNFKQEGLSGIVINLPQAFRPEARSSVP